MTCSVFPTNWKLSCQCWHKFEAPNERGNHVKNYLKICFLLLAFTCCAARSETKQLTEFRVQLPWMHSSQFTGLYIAQMRKHFEKEGLKISLIEGAQHINAITELQENRADIAIVGLGTAWAASREGGEVTNIAQIISGAGFIMACRISAGIYGPSDIAGKKIGIWNVGDRPVIEEMLRRYSVAPESVEFVVQKPDGIDLVKNKVACASAMAFDEYLSMIEKGVPYADLMVFNPALVGVPALLDGVYVKTEDLKKPEFKKLMVGFLRALREGWRETRIAPTLSLEAVRSVTKNFNKDHELKSLESMLNLIPAEPSKFGLLDLTAFENEATRYRNDKNYPVEPEKIWTHSIWNQMRLEDGHVTTFTVATKYYVEHISHLFLFKIFVYFGVFIYALSGVLEAINRNYDLWGRLVLAFLSGIGGGTLRDLIIGGERMPFYYVKDYHYPLGIFIVVAVSSLVVAFYPNAYMSHSFKKIKKYSDVFGFSFLAVSGAVYAIAAGMPWYWVPALAALTCAGGGMLRDIVINQEPATFKGVIYEEAAVIGAIFIVCGLLISNSYEHTAIPVYITIALGLCLIISLRLMIYGFNLKYPNFLGGSNHAAH